jgi:hypothetical protein
MDVFRDAKTLKNISKFECIICNFVCCKKGDYNRHISRPKHQKNIIMTENVTKKTSKNIYLCDVCNKEFMSRNGLWCHKKNCNVIHSTNVITTELIMELIKDNKEMKQIILEQNNTINNFVKNGTINNSNNTINSNNNAFNLQFFLNETCKNAMNITDFVESIKLQLSDLIHLGEVGYVEGISKIIVKNLNALDETERPVHCTDKKRETMYIKDENEWTKEDDNKTKLIKVIRSISNKNIKLLPQFREKYPEYKNSSSKISDTYDKMVIEAMVSDTNKDDKIIKNISKATTLK